MLKAISIDDEEKARKILDTLIREYCADVDLAGQAADLPEGIRLIHKLHPDIVFLDIEMPGYSGLQILDFFNEEDVTFEIIFVTAYSDYAINAFQLSAIDYLLKPIQIDNLLAAVEKVKKKRTSNLTGRLQALRSNLLPEATSITMALPVQSGLTFLSSDSILYLKAEGSYTEFHTDGGTPSITVSKNLKEYERLLELPGFFRPNRSYIINLRHVRQFVKKDGGYVVMSDQTEIIVPTSKKDELVAAIESIRR